MNLPVQNHGGMDIRDQLFETVAVKAQFVLQRHVDEAFRFQARLREEGKPVPRLSKILVDLGFLTQQQVDAIVKGSLPVRGKRFGEIAVAWGFLRQEDLDSAVRHQQEARERTEPPSRLGGILLARGKLEPHQVKAILLAQGKQVVRCPSCHAAFNVQHLQAGAHLACPKCNYSFIPLPSRDTSSIPVLASHSGEHKQVGLGHTVILPKVTVPEDEDWAGTEIGPYVLMERLGVNRLGVLYKARQKETSQLFTLRVHLTRRLPTEEDGKRWEQIGTAAAELRHPHLQRVISTGTHNGLHYQLTEFIEGRSLRILLDERKVPLAPTEALKILIPCAQALAYGHARELIHGDLRPSHILIGKDGKVRVEGLGLPKYVHRDLRMMAMLYGSEEFGVYAAPEVLIAENAAEPRSDVFTLAAVAYHMLTGHPPHSCSGYFDAGLRMASERIVPPLTRNPKLPPYVSRVVEKALCAHPEGRHASMESFEKDLQRCLEAVERGELKQREIAPLSDTREFRGYQRGVRPYRTYLMEHAKQKGKPTLVPVWAMATIVFLGLAIILLMQYRWEKEKRLKASTLKQIRAEKIGGRKDRTKTLPAPKSSVAKKTDLKKNGVAAHLSNPENLAGPSKANDENAKYLEWSGNAMKMELQGRLKEAKEWYRRIEKELSPVFAEEAEIGLARVADAERLIKRVTQNAALAREGKGNETKTSTQGTKEAPNPVPDSQVLLVVPPLIDTPTALRSMNMEAVKGRWTVTPAGDLLGESTETSKIYTLKHHLPLFKWVSVELRGAALGAGLSFGKGSRCLIKPTETWQVLKVEFDKHGLPVMTVDGLPRSSLVPFSNSNKGRLPKAVYLRGQRGKVAFRNVTVDGKRLFPVGLGVPPASLPQTDPVTSRPVSQNLEAEARILEMGWRVRRGFWEEKNRLLTAEKAGPDEILLLSRPLNGKAFQKLTVEIRGEGDAAGFSFGKGRHWLIRPIPEWQRLTLTALSGGALQLDVDGDGRESLEATSVRKRSELGATLFLRGQGERVEFRNFQAE